MSDRPPAPPSPAEVLASLFRAARTLLDHQLGPSPGPFDVELRRAGARHTYRAAAGTPAGHQPVDPPPAERLLALLAASFFSPLEARVVSLLARAGPLKNQGVARRADVGISTAKHLTAQLTARGVLRYSRDGYEVADPEFARLAREAEGSRPAGPPQP